MTRYTLVLLLVVVWCAPAGAQDRWPQFRGPGARGVSAASGLPTRWSTTENVAWVADLPGIGWSSPVVWTTPSTSRPSSAPSRSKSLWAASIAGASRGALGARTTGGIVYALDVGTGAVRWEREVHRGPPARGHHMKNTLASETPVTDGDSVFVYFGNLGVFCLDATDGGLRWSHDMAPSATRLGWAPPRRRRSHDGRLYIVNDNDEQSYLLALGAETGNEVWRTPRDEGTNWSTLHLGERAENRNRHHWNRPGALLRPRRQPALGDHRHVVHHHSHALCRVRPAVSQLGVSRRPATPRLRHSPRRQRRHLASRVGDGQPVHRVVAAAGRPLQPFADRLRRRAVHAPRPGVLHRPRRPNRRGDLLSATDRGRRGVHRIAPGPTTTGSSR